MEELYVEKGYGEVESKRLAELISHNKQAFVNIMMLEELGLAVDDSSPAINGVVTLFSFIIFGLFPLLPYLIDRATHSEPQALLIGSVCTGAFFLFALGFAKAILLGTNKLLSGGLTLILGSAAVAVGYGIGVGLQVS